jgi:uncharacterized membrane protein YkvA (DUF1232 family)
VHTGVDGYVDSDATSLWFMSIWTGLLIGAAVIVSSWALVIALAARLPDGTLKELAGFLPACATTIRRLRGDPRVPTRAKVAVALAGLWVVAPIDLIPEFVPVIGPLDDVVVVALALRYAARQVPRDVLLRAWPGNPSVIERLLGSVASCAPSE